MRDVGNWSGDLLYYSDQALLGQFDWADRDGREFLVDVVAQRIEASQEAFVDAREAPGTSQEKSAVGRSGGTRSVTITSDGTRAMPG